MTFPKNLIRNNTRRLNNRRRRAKNNKKGTSRRQGIVILIRSVACVYEKTKLLWMIKSELCIIMKFFRFPRWMLLVFTKLPTNLWVSYRKSNIAHQTSHRLEKKRTNFVTWTTTADTMTGDEEFLPSEFVPTPLHSLLSDYTNQHVNKMEFNRAYLMRKTPGMCLCIMGCFLFLDPPAILVTYCLCSM